MGRGDAMTRKVSKVFSKYLLYWNIRTLDVTIIFPEVWNWKWKEEIF